MVFLYHLTSEIADHKSIEKYMRNGIGTGIVSKKVSVAPNRLPCTHHGEGLL